MATINGEEKRITVSGEQIEEVVGKVPTVEADVKSNKQNISALQTASAQHTADIARNTADIEKKANADEVYSREETDNAITAKVAEIVAGAPEEFDTLKEMSDWLTEHSDSAATMNTAIQANTKAIADNATDIEENTADIEQNKSDILSAKNDIAINRTTLGMQSKNILPIKSAGITTQGVTFTVNTDGSINAKGTASETTDAFFNFSSNITVPLPGQYILTGCPSGGGGNAYQLYISGDVTIYDSGEGTTAYIPQSKTFGAYIKIAKGRTVDLTFYPMIRSADITDPTYEPYKPSLQEQINALIERITALETTQTTE